MNDNNLVKISKTILCLLRHKPSSNLNIDDSGWVNIDKLLIELNTNSYITVTQKDIFEIVRTDTKSRYIINDNNQIRACQGHSFHLKTPILQKFTQEMIETYPFIIHATTLKAWIQIQQDGYLSKMNRTCVHFATKSEQLRDRPILLQLDIQKALLDNLPIYLSSNYVVLSLENISTDYLKKIDSFIYNTLKIE